MSQFTPGPWRWQLNEKSKRVELVGRNAKYGYNYDLTVMDFVRYGMSGAAPRFRTDDAGLNIMHRAEHWGAVVPGREHHEDWFKCLSNADAHLIASAPSLLAALEAYVADDECCKNPDYDTRVEVHPCPKTCTGNYCKAWKAIEEARGETR